MSCIVGYLHGENFFLFFILVCHGPCLPRVRMAEIPHFLIYCNVGYPQCEPCFVLICHDNFLPTISTVELSHFLISCNVEYPQCELFVLVFRVPSLPNKDVEIPHTFLISFNVEHPQRELFLRTSVSLLEMVEISLIFRIRYNVGYPQRERFLLTYSVSRPFSF